MVAPKYAFEVARDIAAPLSAAEKSALEVCRAKAEAGDRITQYDICEAVGSENWNGGTMAGILNRLQDKGYIERIFYQRGLQICIPGTGYCTAPPPNQTIHWRKRPATAMAPTPTIQAVAQRSHTLLSRMEARAKARGITLNEEMLDRLHMADAMIEQSAKDWGE